MRVLHLSNSDIIGGAAKAAFRVHVGLRESDVDSVMLVGEKSGDAWTVAEWHEGSFRRKIENRLCTQIDLLYFKSYPRFSGKPFSLNFTPNSIADVVNSFKPNLIHLHWINNDLVPLNAFKRFKVPLVWTLHDMWPLTGGCHYDEGCGRFQVGCGVCPQLGSKKKKDLSCRVFNTKNQVFKNLAITCICPSRWIAERAQQSPLLKDKRIEIIPHGIDTNVFKPMSKEVAREWFQFPQDKRLIMFGAMDLNDQRKGFQFLIPALKSLVSKKGYEKSELIVFGSSTPKEPLDLGIKMHYPGRFFDDRTLAMLYSTADVFVMPSMQESFGLTTLEAMACGTPVVAFAVGGAKDMIEHKQSGYLAEPFQAHDLAKGIEWAVDCSCQDLNLSAAVREKVVRKFSLCQQATRHIDIYQEIIGRVKARQ